MPLRCDRKKNDSLSVIVVSTICKCLPPGHHDNDELVVDQAVVVNVSLMKRDTLSVISII
jgi:hypothetical protein